MPKKEELYCGLTGRLMLRSLNQRFECPLSTTRSYDAAQRFTADLQGIILKVKRANGRTRHFDVAGISTHPQEEECVFLGSTVKITGIFLYNDAGGEWESLKPKNFVPALAMFERIYNGHFAYGKPEVHHLLLKLLQLIKDGAATRSKYL